MPEENVKVAVRVRPFNSREKQRNATVIIGMNGATTTIQDPDNPKEEPRKFAFDYSYWSHDQFKEEANGMLVPTGKQYADQVRVYDDLGAGVLKNAWEGFNSTLFAYGQTGSGKSFSMVGYGVNKGIVPIFCDTIFKQIDEKKAAGDKTQFEVTLSMLEIYNEQVRDLLNASSRKGGLKVRQHPKKGFYADGLTEIPVGSYEEIDRKIEEGTKNRTVAATQMNATSSRAHTIVGITFTQKFINAAGEETAKTAIVNLVDLAGSERAESTGATGDRLKEGAAINLSLSSLGNVISALADQSNGKKTKVPYRDSVLTKLLKNALGGNSKTIMIAAVSPADINYEESLSTLRYADRAKQIKTKSTVNEDPTEKLIRELNEENEKLKKMLAGGKITLDDADNEGLSADEKEQLKKEMEEDFKAQLEGNASAMEDMAKGYEEKLRLAREAGGAAVEEAERLAEKKKTTPYIFNLNFDPILTGKIFHFMEDSKTVGNQTGEPSDIVLMGPSIQPHHATFTAEGAAVFLEPTPGSKVLQNGAPLAAKTQLQNNDRLMFGTTQLYVFCCPAAGKPDQEFTFEMAQGEIAANSGFDMNTANKSRDEMLIQEDLMEMLPALEEANSISEDLDKKKKFELMLVSPEARGELKGRTQIFVKMIDLETDYEYNWSREKFLNRKFVMQEMFEKFQDGEDCNMTPDRDPFVEDVDAAVHIGSVKVWMQSLAFNIEINEQLEITDYKGREMGVLNLEMLPCNGKGKPYTEKDDVWVDTPQDLVGKEVNFLVKIDNARGLPNKFQEFYVRYRLYLDEDNVETKHIEGTTNPDWKYNKQYSFKPATDQLMKYLENEAVMLQIWGKYKVPKEKAKVDAKAAFGKRTAGFAAASGKVVDADKVRVVMQLAVSKKRADKAESKLHHIREMVRLAESYQKPRLSVKLIKDILAAPTDDAAQKCLKMVAKEKGAGN